jgi:hypothetical protein
MVSEEDSAFTRGRIPAHEFRETMDVSFLLLKAKARLSRHHFVMFDIDSEATSDFSTQQSLLAVAARAYISMNSKKKCFITKYFWGSDNQISVQTPKNGPYNECFLKNTYIYATYIFNVLSVSYETVQYTPTYPGNIQNDVRIIDGLKEHAETVRSGAAAA